MKKNKIILFAVILLCSLTTVLVADETITEIKVHGNDELSDEEVLAIAGISVGDPVNDQIIEQIDKRLRTSGKFELVEVRKRRTTLSEDGPVAIIIAVRERRSIFSRIMYIPILGFDGNGRFVAGTVAGARNLLGTGERLNGIIILGGTTQLALRARWALDTPIFNQISIGANMLTDNNIHYDIDEETTAGEIELARRYGPLYYAISTGIANTKFGDGIEDDYTITSVTINYDARGDVTLPEDSVYLGYQWTNYNFDGDRKDANIHVTDIRGFKRFLGRNIFGVQFYWEKADAELPLYLRPYIGGSGTLRGIEEGEISGNNLVLATAEVRIPFSSLNSMSAYGVHLFYEKGAVYEDEISLGDVDLLESKGLGAFYFFAGLGLRAEVGFGEDDEAVFHLGGQFRF